MDKTYNQIVSLIWSIADDILRDVFLRGQYRDVILPMVVLRRLDALLEPTKEAVEEELQEQRDAGLGNPDKDAVEQIMTQIIDRVVRQKRKSDNSLYRQYQQNEAFKTNFRTLITRMIETA